MGSQGGGGEVELPVDLQGRPCGFQLHHHPAQLLIQREGSGLRGGKTIQTAQAKQIAGKMAQALAFLCNNIRILPAAFLVQLGRLQQLCETLNRGNGRFKFMA